ncbi:MAG: YraN family protein [Gammaproteobacteria bacterium]|nr:YraN family protein [Gammaproteobacteria bacterium]
MKIPLLKKLSPSQKKGQKFESFSEAYLKKRGLRPITRNFSCRHGEIDLIMQDAQTLVFIEVRYRNNSQFGNALDSITLAKQARIIKTAHYYLQTNRWTNKLFCRFDAMGISGQDSLETQQAENLKVEWVKDAFTLP